MDISNFSATCRRQLLFAIAIVLGSGFFSTAQAQVVHAISTFDPPFDASLAPDEEYDGWRAFECNGLGVCPLTGQVGELLPDSINFLHDADGVGTNATGTLHATDPDSATTALFDAPQKFLDEFYAGRTFMFDMYVDGQGFDNGGTGVVPLFYVSGGAGTMFYVVPENTVPEFAWKTWNIPIAASGGPGAWWVNIGVEDDGTIFDGIFDGGGMPTEVRIWGELTADNPDDVDGVYIDNVKVTSPIPVPAALPLLISALAGLGFAARRKA